MSNRFIAFLLLFLVSWLGANIVQAQNREILYSKSPSAELQKLAEIIQDPRSAKAPYADLVRKSDYFVRIAPRKYILTENKELQDSAILGTKPFVFITTPESVVGKLLLDIYLDIGYEAEDVIRWQRDQEMVAILFHYPEAIKVSDVKDGKLPADWDRYIYVPTWDNLFALFALLAGKADIDPARQGEFAPAKLFFRSKSEQDLALEYPEDGKNRIKATSYAQLRAVGGGDWVYRALLENKLSVFEHFQGNGRTHNEVVDPSGTNLETGVLEFVGPNMKIKDLPQVVLISLGKLTMEETYANLANKSQPKWVPSNGGKVPTGAVEAGYEQQPGTQVLYICRARYHNGLYPGKVRPEFGGCNISWGGTEIRIPDYEVLVQ